MKKNGTGIDNAKKALQLHRSTIRMLATQELHAAVGGLSGLFSCVRACPLTHGCTATANCA